MSAAPPVQNPTACSTSVDTEAESAAKGLDAAAHGEQLNGEQLIQQRLQSELLLQRQEMADMKTMIVQLTQLVQSQSQSQ